MSKTKLILAQESHFSVVFEEGKKMLKELIKKLPEMFSYVIKRSGQEKKFSFFFIPQHPQKMCSVT